MSKTYNVKDISYILDLYDEPNESVDEELVYDLKILGHDKERQDGGYSIPRRRKTSSKCEFREECMKKCSWVYNINVVNGKTRMTCKICEK